MKTSFLQPVLGTVSSTGRCAKKTIVRVSELVDAVFTVHGSLFSAKDRTTSCEEGSYQLSHGGSQNVKV